MKLVFQFSLGCFLRSATASFNCCVRLCCLKANETGIFCFRREGENKYHETHLLATSLEHKSALSEYEPSKARHHQTSPRCLPKRYINLMFQNSGNIEPTIDNNRMGLVL